MYVQYCDILSDVTSLIKTLFTFGFFISLKNAPDDNIFPLYSSRLFHFVKTRRRRPQRTRWYLLGMRHVPFPIYRTFSLSDKKGWIILGNVVFVVVYRRWRNYNSSFLRVRGLPRIRVERNKSRRPQETSRSPQDSLDVTTFPSWLRATCISILHAVSYDRLFSRNIDDLLFFRRSFRFFLLLRFSSFFLLPRSWTLKHLIYSLLKSYSSSIQKVSASFGIKRRAPGTKTFLRSSRSFPLPSALLLV